MTKIFHLVMHTVTFVEGLVDYEGYMNRYGLSRKVIQADFGGVLRLAKINLFAL